MEPAEYRTMAELELRHWWYRARRALLVALVREHSAGEGHPPPRLLDLGSGTGANAAAYAAGARVVGVEPSGEAIRLARSHVGPRFARAEGGRLPFAAGSFRIVTASDVLEHIPDDAAVAREVARVLEPGGAFVFTVPAYRRLWSAHDVALAHQRRYGRPDLRRLLEGAGLRLRWLSYWNTVLFPAAAARRLLSRFRPPAPPASDIGPTGPVAGAALERLLVAEGRLARRLPLPFGLSLVGWAERPQPPGSPPRAGGRA